MRVYVCIFVRAQLCVFRYCCCNIASHCVDDDDENLRNDKKRKVASSSDESSEEEDENESIEEYDVTRVLERRFNKKTEIYEYLVKWKQSNDTVILNNCVREIAARGGGRNTMQPLFILDQTDAIHFSSL